MSKSAFAAVDTLPKADKKSINPRATRYGVVPIWSIPTSSRDFYVWEIPANAVFPFRPFTGEVGYDVYGKELYRVERMPADQVNDMYTISKFFIELTPLAGLEDEARAQRVADILANPFECEKYPVEVGTDCAMCWSKYLRTQVNDVIASEFAEDKELKKVAKECVNKLLAGLTEAIEEARRQVDVAIRDIDDPKSGKSMFFDHDYKNVFNIHADRPQYKTTTSNADVGAQIAGAIRDLVKKDEAPQVDLAKLIAEAVAAETAALKEELDRMKSPAPSPVPEAEVEESKTKKK